MPDRPTPYLLVDAGVLAANVHAMARFADDRGLLLRPHTKTHKTQTIALCCVATVVSHASGNVLLDAGSKALDADQQACATG